MRKGVWLFVLVTSSCLGQNLIKGKVFEDVNKNKVFDRYEPILSDVLVSNGKDVVKTDVNGNYSIEVLANMPVFIIQPKNYSSNLKEDNKVDFFIPYEKAIQLKSFDFALNKQDQSSYSMTLLGDLQVDVIDDVQHVEKLVVEELALNVPNMVFPLGDLSFDNLKIFDTLSKSLGLIGSPIYYVAGNHDLNFDHITDISKRDLDYKKHFGPSYYALVYNNELIVVLNNIIPTENHKYIGAIDRDQTIFLKAVLENFRDKVTSVKVMMHIPIEFMSDQEEFIALFDDFREVFVGVGHTHTQYHKYFERKNAPAIHQLVAGAVCGSWWQGPHDIEGIPFAMMYDGTWKGYWNIQKEADSEKLSYKVSGRSKDKQMQIWVPEYKEWDKIANNLNEDYVYANVFAADSQTKVEVSFDGFTWLAMDKYVGLDPNYTRLVLLQTIGRFKSLNTSPVHDAQRKSEHLWRYAIPTNLPKGKQLVYVRTYNQYLGLNHTATKVLERR